MSEKPGSTTAVERVSLDDIRHRAESVKSKAVSEAKGAVDTVVGEDGKRALLIVAGLVLVAASVAYYLGTRAGRASGMEDLLGE